jgi:hypothetical protein
MNTKIKPRRMWANYYSDYDLMIHTSRKTAQSCAQPSVILAAVPVAVIPLHENTTLGDSMVSALTSLGVLPKPRKGGRK